MVSNNGDASSAFCICCGRDAVDGVADDEGTAPTPTEDGVVELFLVEDATEEKDEDGRRRNDCLAFVCRRGTAVVAEMEAELPSVIDDDVEFTFAMAKPGESSAVANDNTFCLE